MKRTTYTKPTTEVVNLRHQCHILAGSGVGATRDGYDTASGYETIWE
jgi:hypothetical protein